MDRKMIFRGKPLDGDGWAVGSLMCWPDGRAEILVPNPVGEVACHSVDPATVGQYVGFDAGDADYVFVFEGDLIGHEYGAEYPPYIVCMDDEGCWCILEQISECCEPLAGLALRTYSVVGNVWDNPEMVQPGVLEKILPGFVRKSQTDGPTEQAATAEAP